MDLIQELKHLIAELKREKVEFALCGGLAMAVYTFPRATMDIDIMIEPDSLSRVKKTVAALDFSVDTGLMKFKKDSIQIYRLCKISPVSKETIILDLLLVSPEIADVWNSRQIISWEEGKLPVISPQGLIRLKSIRGSGQDKDDIDHLKRLIDED
jgi:hypothetical protein